MSRHPFAGVEPFNSYKQWATTTTSSHLAEQRYLRELERVEEEQNQLRTQAEQEAAGVIREFDFYTEYAASFNEFRNRNGLPQLEFRSELNDIAATRAEEIATDFSHDGIKQYNLGENIAMLAYSSDGPQQLLQLWADSPRHRANMLSGSYSFTGFAKNGRFAVQLFSW